MKPSIGRIVHYRLTKEEADKMMQRRTDAKEQSGQMQRARPGFQAHVGNPLSEGEAVPMIIVQVWPNEHGPDHDGVNGQALLDGNDSLWVTSAKEGEGPGTWCWPPRVEG
jgi:hypothetical protein